MTQTDWRNPQLPISILDTEGKTVVNIQTHHVDFQNADHLKAVLNDLAEQGKHKIILNLDHVTFMDSIGLSVLTLGKRLMDQCGGSFSICGLQHYVNNLIVLTKLGNIIPVFRNDQDALRSL